MTVEELINELQKIGDKTMNVIVSAECDVPAFYPSNSQYGDVDGVNCVDGVVYIDACVNLREEEQ